MSGGGGGCPVTLYFTLIMEIFLFFPTTLIRSSSALPAVLRRNDGDGQSKLNEITM